MTQVTPTHPVDGVSIEAAPWAVVLEAHKAAEAVEDARVAVGEFYLTDTAKGGDVLQLGAGLAVEKLDDKPQTICR